MKIILILFIITIIVFLLCIYNKKQNEPFINELMPQFMGGLGNNLFQLASSYGLAHTYNKEFKINKDKIAATIHADNTKYFNSIFKNFNKYFTENNPINTLNEEWNDKKFNYSTQLTSTNDDILVKGYFQDYTLFHHIKDEFISLLHFDKSITEKYPLLNESAFIHIRGGDYKNNKLYAVPLENYYNKAITKLQSHNIPHYYIFTNDINYAKQFDWINTINHTFIDENEEDSLYLMSQCKYGGIGVNSSFSWWGLYLNTNRPYLILPSKWFNESNQYIDGLYFPNSIKIDV